MVLPFKSGFWVMWAANSWNWFLLNKPFRVYTEIARSVCSLMMFISSVVFEEASSSSSVGEIPSGYSNLQVMIRRARSSRCITEMNSLFEMDNANRSPARATHRFIRYLDNSKHSQINRMFAFGRAISMYRSICSTQPSDVHRCGSHGIHLVMSHLHTIGRISMV